MAVRVIYGAPRSGKTYYAVNHLTKTYFDCASDGLYTLKDKFKDLVIFSNIDALKLPHKNLSEAIRTIGGPDKFFSYEYQEKIFRKYPQVCYFIDEAQMIFPDNFRENKVFNWFQYHGHWGQDIYLMTQDIKLLPRQITVLSEITIKALPRSTSIFGGRDLRYNLMLGAGTEVGDKILLVKKQSIFDLYCSQNSTEANKVKNPFIKYFVILFIAILVAGWNFKKLLSGWASSSAESLSDVQASVSSSLQSPGFPHSPASKLLDLPNSSSASSVSSVSPPDPLRPYTLSYVTHGKAIFIFFDGQIFPLSQFPFAIKKSAFNLFAMIPTSLYDRLASDDSAPSGRADPHLPDKSTDT